jgi:hypothetical protein
MPWRQAPDPQTPRPGRGHEVPDHSGETIIPGYKGREGRAKKYAREPMTRDQAEAIQIALGQATGGLVPIEKKLSQDERGYNLVLPAEWFRDCIPGLQALVAKAGRR